MTRSEKRSVRGTLVILMIPILLSLSACNTLFPSPASIAPSTATATKTPTNIQTETVTPTLTPTITVTPTTTETPTPTNVPLDALELTGEGVVFLRIAQVVADVWGVNVDTLYSIGLVGEDPLMPFGIDSANNLYGVVSWDFCIDKNIWAGCGSILLVKKSDLSPEYQEILTLDFLENSSWGDSYFSLMPGTKNWLGLDFESKEVIDGATTHYPFLDENTIIREAGVEGVMTVDCDALVILVSTMLASGLWTCP